jgi:hypothetical protein
VEQKLQEPLVVQLLVLEEPLVVQLQVLEEPLVLEEPSLVK